MRRSMGAPREFKCEDCREWFELDELTTVEWTMPGHNSAYYVLCWSCAKPLQTASDEMNVEGITQALYYRPF